MNKAYFCVDKIKRLRDILPRDSPVAIYKSIIRPHLDYGDIIYDQRNNDSFNDKIEQLQYKACLGITGAIQETSRECLNNVLRLENLSSRRWCRKLCAICKTKKNWLFQIFFFSKFSIWMIATCARNTKLEFYCSFQKQTSIFYKT